MPFLKKKEHLNNDLQGIAANVERRRSSNIA